MSLRRFWSRCLLFVGLCSASTAYSQQPLLQITSPSNQSSAPEGETLTITVAADPSVQGVYVTTQDPPPNVQPTSSTTQFSLTLPTTVTPGLYQITAVGVSGGGYVVMIDSPRDEGEPYQRVTSRRTGISQEQLAGFMKHIGARESGG